MTIRVTRLSSSAALVLTNYASDHTEDFQFGLFRNMNRFLGFALRAKQHIELQLQRLHRHFSMNAGNHNVTMTRG
ncbi:hypothetical protein N5P32_01185 [Marinomonas pontica]|nr:hypothetical protein [Marinomonas pontica]MCW8354599.1 hypothetical protein [Marinomonas pontica]